MTSYSATVKYQTVRKRINRYLYRLKRYPNL